jgi:hypothetical protein
MKKSQQNQITYVNRHRISTSEYQMKDQIWLCIKNIQIDRSFKKLDHKMIKSFKILKKRDSSYKLDLSNEMNIHSIFHISLLRKDFQNLISNQIIFSSSLIIIDNEKKYDVEDIIDSRLIERAVNKRLQYKIRWIEHSSNRKWYSIENFNNATKIVVDYHDRYSNKSNSHSIIVSLITLRIMKIDWIKQNMKNAQSLIQKTLDRMKKKINSTIKSSIFSIDRNVINIETASQDSFVTKTTSVERILSNQKREKIVSRSRVIHSIKWSVSERVNKRD